MRTVLKSRSLTDQTLWASRYDSQLERKGSLRIPGKVGALERSLPKLAMKLKPALLAEVFCGCA
ncbi:hypothetical protein D3C85_1925250 [compost metagenome]